MRSLSAAQRSLSRDLLTGLLLEAAELERPAGWSQSMEKVLEGVGAEEELAALWLDGCLAETPVWQDEEQLNRLRRAEIGTHHHISGQYLHSYANEMAWREDYRREPNGTQYLMVAAAALGHPVSRQWKGYWQRSAIQTQ